jgi:hypothetical protein
LEGNGENVETLKEMGQIGVHAVMLFCGHHAELQVPVSLPVGMLSQPKWNMDF